MIAYQDTKGELILNIDLREKNFAAFEAVYGCRPKIAHNENEIYKMGISKNGEAVLSVRNALPSGNLRMNSLYDPSYEAKRWAKEYEGYQRKATVVLLGFSNGVFLRALYITMRPDTSFFVYEPNEALFSFVCAFIDLSDIINDPRVRLYVTDEQKAHIADELITNTVNFKPETVGITTPFYAECPEFEDVCHQAERVMEATRNYQSTRARDALKARISSWNRMRNASTLKALKNVFPADAPVVIVSAGPSLLKNVDRLKSIKGHAFILCTDRAVSVLDDHGIIPDAIISLDSIKSSDYMRAKIAEKVPLICSHQVSIAAQELFEGRLIFYHSLEYELALMGDRMIESNNGLDQGGNVAGGAFSVCKMLGVKLIIFIGQDLAFEDGKHHADDRDEGASYAGKREIEGIDGNKVLSSDMWIGFKDYFERQIAMNPELRVIDATEGGARIKGTEIDTLQNVCDMVKDKSFDFTEMINNLPKAQTDDEYEQMIYREKQWISDLDKIALMSKEIVNICDELIESCKETEISALENRDKLEKLYDLRNEINSMYVYSLMEEYWIRDIYSIPDHMMMLRNNQEAKKTLEYISDFFRNLPQDCKSLKEEMISSMK